jgi:hypothetical protein
MSDETVDTVQRRVLGPQLRAWLTFIVAFVVGFAITVVLWTIGSGRDVQAILGLATLVGILATATGTVVLALKTSDLASATEQMATAALQEAGATARSVELPREELEAVKTQANSPKNSSAWPARSSMRPVVQIVPSSRQMPVSPYPTEIMGNVNYVAGREPAYDIEVWGRGWASFSGGKIAAILAPPGRYSFTISTDEALGPLSAEALARWPFPDVQQLPDLAENESWVGVTWKTHDGYWGHQLNHLPAGKPREYHPPVLEPGPQP